ncbi:MAG TPA: TetR/AcrR family transcriptional regulator [Acidimicrobiales bacterium]
MAVPAETTDAPVGVRARRLAERRAELLDAAVRVIRREGDQVAMEDIATEAGISRPILYRHFGDARGLYDAVARHYGEQLVARLAAVGSEGRPPRSGRALLHRQVVTFLGFVAEQPNLYRFLVRRAPARSGPKASRSGLSRLISGTTARFLTEAGWDAATATVAGDILVGGLEATADRWLDEPLGSHEEVAELVTDLVWSGFAGAARQAEG